MIRGIALAASCFAISGCGVMSASTGTISASDAASIANWRGVATQNDRMRLRDWNAAWEEALRQARRSNTADVAREGALFEPLTALPNPLPPPGDYRCRTIKLGSAGGAGLTFIAYPYFRCRITANAATFSFAKLDGSQRQNGVIYSDTATRGIMLGTLALGDERTMLDYGTDPSRDVAGIVERVGERRWRIAFPRPAFESVVDVLELLPEG